jgi:O-antigen ligase
MNISLFFIPLVPVIWVFPVFVLLLYMNLGNDLLRKRGWGKSFEPVDGLVIIFLLACSLSFLEVDLDYRSPQNYLRYYFSTYLLPVLAYFAIRLTRFTNKKAQNLRRAALASAVVFALCCIFEYAFSHPLVPEFDNEDQWIGGMVFRAGSLAGGCIVAGEMLAFFIALTIPYVFFRYPGKKNFKISALLILEILGLGVTFARAGYISALACATLAPMFLRGRNQGRLLIVMGMLLLLIIILPSLPLPDWLIERITGGASTYARVPRFWAGLYFIQDNFFRGWTTVLFGRGYIASYLYGYDYFPGLNRLGGDLEETFSGSFLSGGFHNGYLTLLADQGLVAFLCYLAIVVQVLRRMWRYSQPLRLLEKPVLKSQAVLEPVAWGLVVIVHLVTETVHWSTNFPAMTYFFIAAAMVLNLTSSAALEQQVCDVKAGKPMPSWGSIGARLGFQRVKPVRVAHAIDKVSYASKEPHF